MNTLLIEVLVYTTASAGAFFFGVGLGAFLYDWYESNVKNRIIRIMFSLATLVFFVSCFIMLNTLYDRKIRWTLYDHKKLDNVQLGNVDNKRLKEVFEINIK